MSAKVGVASPIVPTDTDMQSRRMSFIESVVATAIGFGTGILGQLLIFPLVGMQVSFDKNIVIAAAFTVISILRGYFVRRLFNWIHLHWI